MKRPSELAGILADLVAFQSVTGNHKAASACLDYVEGYLTARGLSSKRSESNGFPSLVATTRDTKRPKVLLQAHIDVVAAPDFCFELKEEDGKLQGRGVFDMKFAAAVFLKLVDDLKDKLADYDFGIMLTSDEEIGGRDGVKALLDAGYRTEVCVLPDAGENWQIETSHKGCWTIRACAVGQAAHGSRPWEGDNAIDRLVDMLSETRQLFDGQNTDSDTLSITKITGGEAVNQVADKAEATLDIRFVSKQSYERLHTDIKALAERHGIKLEDVRLINISKTNMDHELVARFLDIAVKVHKKPLGKVRSLGTSDAYYFGNLGIPVILARPEGGSPHADAEWISSSGLEKYYELIKAYVQEVSAT